MKKMMIKIKEILGTPQARYGSYSTLLVAVAVAIVIMINMVAGQFPERWKNMDLSSNNLYEITDQSKALLKSLDKKVEIHILAEKDTTDERIKVFVEKYAGLSKKVSVKWTDPVLHPTVLTANNAESNTIVVSCEDTGKSTKIAMGDIITYDETSYYYYGTYEETSFDAEGQLTSAVNYVVNDKTQKIYYTAGHGEQTLSDTLSDLFTKSNFSTEEINTLVETEIPEDCELLFLYGPTTDFTEDEVKNISTYLQNGGNVLYLMGETDKDMPNINGLLKEYGMEVVEGYMADMERCYQQNPYYVFPTLSVSGDMAANLESEMVLMLYPRGMQTVDPARDTITVESFMSTSSSGGYKVTEEAQEQGSYVLGAVATEEEARLTVITSDTLVNESITKSYTTLENNTLFMNAVTSNFDEVSNVSIEAKSLATTYNTMQRIGLSTLIVIVGVPLVILVGGFVTWLKRRKA